MMVDVSTIGRSIQSDPTAWVLGIVVFWVWGRLFLDLVLHVNGWAYTSFVGASVLVIVAQIASVVKITGWLPIPWSYVLYLLGIAIIGVGFGIRRLVIVKGVFSPRE